MASFHSHYLTFTPQTYHHPVHRFRSWHTQTTSLSHSYTQVRVQPRNTSNHTYIQFLPGQNNLLLNPDKTTCTLFTPDPAEYTSNLDLTINNKALPMATHPKLLGLTLAFHVHILELISSLISLCSHHSSFLHHSHYSIV